MFEFSKMKFKSNESQMKQNNSTDLFGYSSLAIHNENDANMPQKHEIQIIGNPSNTKKQMFRGRSDLY